MEPYKGLYIEPQRVGIKGEWVARYGSGDFSKWTKRFRGAGAKAASVRQAMLEIDALTADDIAFELGLEVENDTLLAKPETVPG